MARIEAAQADLASAWTTLRDGDTLALKGKIAGWRPAGRKFAVPVTLDLSAAEVSDFYVSGMEGLRFVGGLVRPGPAYSLGLRLAKSANLTFEGVKLAGTGTDFRSWDTALWLEYCVNVSIADCAVSETVIGIKLYEVDGAQVRRVLARRMKADAIDLYGVRDFMVEECDLAEFVPAEGSHPDGIQALSNSGRPKTARGTIRRNRITGMAQPIFLGAGDALVGFDDVAIVENEVEGGFPNGIYVGHGRGITVKNNRVRTLPGATWQSDIKLPNCINPVRSGNLVEGYTAPSGRVYAALADPDYVPPAPPPPPAPAPAPTPAPAPAPAPTPTPAPAPKVTEIVVARGETVIVRGA